MTARPTLQRKLTQYLEGGKWRAAEDLLRKELSKSPTNHWLLTQLAAAVYEQQRYAEAHELLNQSLELVPDCPLTLWHLAGVKDAAGDYAGAIRILRALVESQTTPAEDPCWESAAWADSLKADCVFSLGVCYRRLGRRGKAERCFRQYLDLMLAGIEGIYSADDVISEITKLRTGNDRLKQRERRKVFDAVAADSGR